MGEENTAQPEGPQKESSFLDKLTRKERRAFQRKMKKPKYQKMAKRVIDQKQKEKKEKQLKRAIKEGRFLIKE